MANILDVLNIFYNCPCSVQDLMGVYNGQSGCKVSLFKPLSMWYIVKKKCYYCSCQRKSIIILVKMKKCKSKNKAKIINLTASMVWIHAFCTIHHNIRPHGWILWLCHRKHYFLQVFNELNTNNKKLNAAEVSGFITCSSTVLHFRQVVVKRKLMNYWLWSII